MDAAKITLSEEEMQLVENAEWILTKNGILKKAFTLLGSVQEQIVTLPETRKLPIELLRISPKISQGENYLGLPYRILDFPRIFTKEDCFAIRCFFWWGRFFSITLHLKGEYLERYRSRVAAGFGRLQSADYFISSGSDEWQHHLEADNYTPLKELDSAEFASMLSAGSFVKIACSLPISEWANATEWYLKNYALLVEMISSPHDGTDL